MPNSPQTPGIVAQRLPSEHVAQNFATYQPAYAAHEARVAADRCYFCHDAPCMTACPTAIDIPLFIRQIATGTPDAAAKTIFAQNIMGGMCARVCPTETLCEEVCVREVAEGKPVEIGGDRGPPPLDHAGGPGRRVGRHQDVRQILKSEPGGRHGQIVSGRVLVPGVDDGAAD